MSIQLRFFGGTNFASRAIEWFSAGPFSHVAAVWGDTELLDARTDHIGTAPPGVQFRLKALEVAPLMVTMELPTTASQLALWQSFLTKQIGLPYDKPGIFGFALDRDWREPDSWFCSELQAAALETAGICPRLYAPANKITPSALATIVSAIGGKVIA